MDRCVSAVELRIQSRHRSCKQLSTMRTIAPVVVAAVMAGIGFNLPLQAAGSSDRVSAEAVVSATFAEAQRLFYSGRYDEAAALALDVRSTNPEDLAAFELRSSALLFQ